MQKVNHSFTSVYNVDSLTCFDPEVHQPSYYNPCEAEIRRVQQLKASFKAKGSTYIHHKNLPICSSDGHFAKIQVKPDDFRMRYCSSPSGKQIENYGPFSIESLQGRKSNCECAQARHYMTHNKPKCCSNGNYVGRQCLTGMCFCVDQFGRQTGPEVEQNDAESLNCPDFCCQESDYKEKDFCYE